MKKIIILSLILTTLVIANDEKVQTVGVSALYSSSLYIAKNEIKAIPLINLSYKNFYLKGLKIGFSLYEEPKFRFSVLLDPLAGYFDGWAVRAKDMKRYKNINNRNPQVLYGLSTDFNFDITMGNINYLWGEKGEKGEITLSFPIEVTERLNFIFSGNTKYYQGKWINYYLGVTEKEVVKNTGLIKYKGKDSYGGGISVTAEFAITPQLILNSYAGIEWYNENITSSPLVKDNKKIYGGLGIRYSF